MAKENLKEESEDKTSKEDEKNKTFHRRER